MTDEPAPVLAVRRSATLLRPGAIIPALGDFRIGVSVQDDLIAERYDRFGVIAEQTRQPCCAIASMAHIDELMKSTPA